ncbi:MAG: DUF4340 domain-containing protein, partial [Clostridia bacterium]|nr:DUF4340 domain-containing protein [Clostridia bacterium]
DLLGIQDRPYIYDVIPLEKVSTIEIQNIDPETGDKRNFSFYMDPVAKNLILSGREMLSFDKEKLSYLYVNTCNMLSMAKVDSPSEDLSQYGLSDGKSENWFIVTDTDGNTKQVFIGDKLPTGAAYYCKSADKPHIYVIDTMIEMCVLASPDDFIVPMLCPPVSQEKMYDIDDIKIISGGELKVNFMLAPKELSGKSDATAVSHVMTYPGGYTVSQAVVDNILLKLSGFKGTEVVTSDLFGVYTSDPENSGDSEVVLKSVLEKYGFIKPSFEIHYILDGNKYKIVFGAKTPDNSSYYALNMTQMTICTVPCSDVPFLEYELIDFVDEYIFQMNIDSLASIDVKTRNAQETFLLSGEGQNLKVTRKSTGAVVDTKTFRQFYIDILLVALDGNAEERSMRDMVLSYTFNDRSGKSYEYNFYDISTTKVFYTVDGKGEFYVNRDDVDKIINNFKMLLDGKSFVSDAIGG